MKATETTEIKNKKKGEVSSKKRSKSSHDPNESFEEPEHDQRSDLRVKDIRKISKTKQMDEKRIHSCDRLFISGLCPQYTYRKKKKDVRAIAWHFILHGNSKPLYKRKIAKGLWFYHGDDSLSKLTGRDPSRDRVQPVDPEQILDAVLFMLEEKFVKRREGTKDRTMAALTKHHLRGLLNRPYKEWMDTLEYCGILIRMRNHLRGMHSPSGKGMCRGYGLDRRVISDHSKAYWNRYTSGQAEKVNAGVCEKSVDRAIRYCLERASEEAETPDPKEEKDPTQKEHLRIIKEESQKAFSCKTDQYGQRVHHSLTSLKKDIREQIQLEGRLAVSMDIKACFPRSLASGAMEAFFAYVLGDAFTPDDELKKMCEEGDPYKLLEENLGSRDKAKELFSMALHAPTYNHNSYLKPLEAAYPKTGKNIRRVKEKIGHHNFIRELQAIEHQWMQPLIEACANAHAPAIPVYDEVLVPERMVSELESVAKENGLPIEVKG
jgi:hypothetical protein